MIKNILFLIIPLMPLAFPLKAQAALVLTASEVGGDVVITGSGTVNLTDLTFINTGGANPMILPSRSVVILGRQGSTDIYSGIDGPSSFGPGSTGSNPGSASASSGDIFGIQTSTIIRVPTGYTSGTFLSGTSTFTNQSFDSLGMTPGTYTYTWGTGVNADSATFQIGSNAVPEPSSLTLLGLVAAGAWAARRRVHDRRQAAAD